MQHWSRLCCGDFNSVEVVWWWRWTFRGQRADELHHATKAMHTVIYTLNLSREKTCQDLSVTAQQVTPIDHIVHVLLDNYSEQHIVTLGVKKTFGCFNGSISWTCEVKRAHCTSSTAGQTPGWRPQIITNWTYSILMLLTTSWYYDYEHTSIPVQIR